MALCLISLFTARLYREQSHFSSIFRQYLWRGTVIPGAPTSCAFPRETSGSSWCLVCSSKEGSSEPPLSAMSSWERQRGTFLPWDMARASSWVGSPASTGSVPHNPIKELLDEAKNAFWKISLKFNHSWGNAHENEMKLLSRRVIHLLIIWGMKYCGKKNGIYMLYPFVVQLRG